MAKALRGLMEYVGRWSHPSQSGACRGELTGQGRPGSATRGHKPSPDSRSATSHTREAGTGVSSQQRRPPSSWVLLPWSKQVLPSLVFLPAPWSLCLHVCTHGMRRVLVSVFEKRTSKKDQGVRRKTREWSEAVREKGLCAQVAPQAWAGGSKSVWKASRLSPLHFQVSQNSLTMLSSPSPGQQVQTPQSMPPPPQPSPQPGQPSSQPNSNVR